MADLITLQRKLGVEFRDPSLLELALVHSSYVNEKSGTVTTSNERLEFLGDAVLGLITAEGLYQTQPNATEGDMTRLRATLVRRETLAAIAEAISLGNYLYLGRGEETSGGRHKMANLASALEAVIAAIYLDQGWNVTRDFVLRLLSEELETATRQEPDIDYKSQLQHVTQASHQITPTYHLVEAVGPDHDRRFTVEVRAGDHTLGRGSGKNKKAAETEAAHAALKSLSNGFTP